MKVTMLAHTPEPEKVIAAAAKLCYSQKADIETLMSDLTEENVEAFIKKLEGFGHESPFEHVSFTFGIEGVSRALTHQLTRSRIASFSQRSQRYCGEENFKYVTPQAIAANPVALMIFEHEMQEIAKAYKALTELGIPNEDARAVLPNACETRIIMTMNVRELWHWLNERMCSRAQLEIRQLATEILRQCKEVSPLLFAHAGAKCVKGYCPEGDMSCGRVKTLKEILADSEGR